MVSDRKKEHHPPHIFINNALYFVTARVYAKQSLLNTDQRKDLLLENISSELKDFGFKLFAWVVLDNHYHIQFKTKIAKSLSQIFNNVHGRVSLELNRQDNARGRKVFQNYWDVIVDEESSFWRHFNYIHHNPVKHGYCQNQNEVLSYKFCSYKQWVEKKGQEWMDSCFENYPIADWTVSGEE